MTCAFAGVFVTLPGMDDYELLNPFKILDKPSSAPDCGVCKIHLE